MLCGRRDSNSHELPRQILSLVRLPIPPLPRGCKDKQIAVRNTSLVPSFCQKLEDFAGNMVINHTQS